MKTKATKEQATTGLVPKLRFPEFREAEGWKTKLLGNLCKIRTGKKDANEGASDGQYPFFTCAENHIFSNSYSFDAEAILIAGNANVGQTKYYCGKFEAYQRTYVLTDFSGINVPYLYAVLNAKLRESLLAQVQVSAMSYIKLPMLQEYPLAVPPSSAEQQKIAECLSSVDELIAAQARKVDTLKTHKKGLMQQLFPREGETQPRLCFPEFKNAGDWKFQTLADIAKISSGTTPLRSNLEFFAGGSIPWVKTTDLNNSFITKTEENITPKAKARINPIGSVLVAMYGGFNQIGRTGCLSVPAATNQALSVLVLDQDLASPVYVLAWLNAKVEDWKRIASSSRKDPNITSADVAKFPISLPMPAEQQRIADCLSSLDALITAATQKLDALKLHKRGLMQQLFPSPEEVQA